MKKTKNTKKLILCTAALLLMTASAFAEYPPDNAAVLYYKAFMLYKPDDTMGDMLSDYAMGKTTSNEKLTEFLNKSKTQRIIGAVTDASQIQNCDWGLNLDEGFEMEMPFLGSLRKLTYLILADAKLLAEQGDYKAAFSQCVAVKKMAVHAGDDTLISFLVSVAINALANGAVQDILSSDIDIPTLNQLKDQIQSIQTIQPQAKDALANDLSIALNWKEQAIKEIPVESFSDDPKDQQKFREIVNNDELLTKNFEYFKQYMNLVVQAFSLPYPKGYEKLKEIRDIPVEDAKSNPEAYFTAVFFPAVSKVYILDLRARANEYALNCAVDIFIENAKYKKLPDSLPANSPVNPFSGKPFVYEKTNKGFTLKCDENSVPQEEKKYMDKYEFEYEL
jgi:hypothetical protein